MIKIKIEFIIITKFIFISQKNMDYQKYILPSFLNDNMEATNPFDKFDLTFFARIIETQSVVLCAVCLKKSIFPSRPNRCSHKFCYRCIKLWSNEKKSCPICRRNFERIIRC